MVPKVHRRCPAHHSCVHLSYVPELSVLLGHGGSLWALQVPARGAARGTCVPITGSDINRVLLAAHCCHPTSTLTCGTHRGDTKLVASMTGSPVSDNMSIRRIFTGVGTTL